VIVQAAEVVPTAAEVVPTAAERAQYGLARAQVNCPGNTLAAGGGVGVGGDPSNLMVLPNEQGPIPSDPGTRPTGWYAYVTQYGTGSVPWQIYIWVLCAPGS
jgi:hypothetical protein